METGTGTLLQPEKEQEAVGMPAGGVPDLWTEMNALAAGVPLGEAVLMDPDQLERLADYSADWSPLFVGC